jgi:hypothetical protein
MSSWIRLSCEEAGEVGKQHQHEQQANQRDRDQLDQAHCLARATLDRFGLIVDTLDAPSWR